MKRRIAKILISTVILLFLVLGCNYYFQLYAFLSESLPTIVMGDMNDFSGMSPLKTLKSADLKDAWWEGGKGLGPTFHEGWMHFRLDHIL